MPKIDLEQNLEFVIAGHSHIFAMGAEQGYEGPISLQPIADYQGGYFLNQPWNGDRLQVYWDFLVESCRERAAVLVHGGNQHYSNFLLAQQPLFDFFDPADPEQPLYPGSVAVPRLMVKAFFLNHLGLLVENIRRLKAIGCPRVLVTGTPPVRQDFAVAMTHIRESESWRKIAEQIGLDLATVDPIPAPIMKRLWGTIQDAMADIARNNGAVFLPVCPEALTADGYVKAAYYGYDHDPGHHNAAYGRLMLDHVVRALRNPAGVEAIR